MSLSNCVQQQEADEEEEQQLYTDENNMNTKQIIELVEQKLTTLKNKNRSSKRIPFLWFTKTERKPRSKFSFARWKKNPALQRG